MVHNIQQEEKERVIKAIREQLKDNICDREFDIWNGDYYEMYYNLCVTKYDTVEEFWNAFDTFVKIL